jgi:long-subunit acyl-CoA synthetase (AMP-forming)
VVDKEGKVLLKQGAIGEIHIYNADAMKGYLNNITATREAFTPDHWVRTGDIGYIKDKNWYVVDRAKDLIKVRGWQVSPAEIEAALLEHPDIRDAGVIGIPAPDGCGESPMAFIVVNEGSSLDESQVKLFLATRLARYKNVEEVNFVDRIPRNPIGKILRRALRDMRGTEQPTPDQTAAKEYATALQKISVYEKLKMSESEKTISSSSLAIGESKQIGFGEELETKDTGGKKRKLCRTSHFWQWRKRRILTRSQKSLGSLIRVDGGDVS